MWTSCSRTSVVGFGNVFSTRFTKLRMGWVDSSHSCPISWRRPNLLRWVPAGCDGCPGAIISWLAFTIAKCSVTADWIRPISSGCPTPSNERPSMRESVAC